MSRVTKGIPEWQTGIAELSDYVDGEYNHIITMLNIYNEAPSVYERYDKYRWSEPVRSSDIDFCCRKRCDSGHHKSLWKPYKSKPKENK
jgi:hypothetical protein